MELIESPHYQSDLQGTEMKLFIISAVATTVMMATSCRQRKPTSGNAGLRGMTFLSTIDGSQIKSEIAPDNSVTFYIEINGQKEPVAPMDDSPTRELFFAKARSTDVWEITWRNVVIGEKRGDITEICGEKFGHADICEAIFVQRPANEPGANNTLILGLLEKGLEQIHEPELSSKSKKIKNKDSTRNSNTDISGYAMAQINQRNTGTCLYNSTTGIIEWYRNKQNNIHERLSAPDVLARLSSDDSIGEKLALMNSRKNLGGVVPDSYLKTQNIYDSNPNTFTDALNSSRRQASVLASTRVDIPDITTTILFMHQEPASNIRNNTFATSDDMQKVRDWLVNKQRPVHLFHLYGNTTIWHAVIALGWDDSRGLILIKDSLGGTNYLGTWRSIADMQRGAYGAIGTMEAEGTNTGDNDSVRIPDSNSNSGPNSGSSSSSSSGSNSVERVTFKSSLAMSRARDYLYIYSNRKVTSLEIQDIYGRWLPLDINYIPQAGWSSIGAIWVDESWRRARTDVAVRAIINGYYYTATVLLDDKR